MLKKGPDVGATVVGVHYSDRRLLSTPGLAESDTTTNIVTFAATG